MKYILLITLLFLAPVETTLTRSPYRSPDPSFFMLTVRWEGDTREFHIRDPHLGNGPNFSTFDQEHFTAHLLPNGPIHFRYDQSKTVTGKHLSALLEQVVQEIMSGKTEFEHFIPLKMRDFRRRKSAGFVVLKAKQFPFVAKISIENPKSFVFPYKKGFEPSCFFIIGEGSNRHICGFTRIKNLEAIQQKITHDDTWKSQVTFPRKWFWIPHKVRWMEFIGSGIRGNRYTKVPSIYAVIADVIEAEREMGITNKQDRTLCLALSEYLDYRIDAHIKNFLVEKGTHKIALIDTEHFPTLVGLKEKPHITGYTSWYGTLAKKYVHEKFACSKTERINRQLNPPKNYLPL